MVEKSSTYKEIIYLDEIELNSALAQLQGGLKQSLTASSDHNQMTESSNTISGEGQANFSAVVAKAEEYRRSLEIEKQIASA